MRLTACLDVVCPQCFEIAYVKPPVGNDRIRKRRLRHLPRLFFLRLIGRSESALFAIRLRGRLHQHAISILVVKVYMPIGVGYRTHAETIGLPFHLPRSELNRDQGTLGGSRAVKIVADQHRPAEAVRKPALEVNLFCGDSAAVRFQTNESASYTKRPAVHIVATRDRRESLRRALDHFLVAPEEGARLRINSDDALAQKLHVLFAPA